MARALLRTLATGERAQTAVEYLLVVAVIATAFVLAMVFGVPQLLTIILGVLCPGIDTAVDPPATIGSCIGP